MKAKFKKGQRCYIFNKDEDPKVISCIDLEGYLDQGYEPTPLKFLKLKDHGIDSKNQIQIQELGSAINGVTQSINGALNLHLMTRKELYKYCKEHFGVKLKRTDLKPVILAQAQSLVLANIEVN